MAKLPQIILAVWLMSASSGLLCAAEAPITPPPKPMILDMVHYNPGEPRYQTRFEDPSLIKSMGYTGKVYFLFDSPVLAVDWEKVDPEIFPKGSEGRKGVDETAARIDKELAECKAQGLETYAMGDLILFPKTLVTKYGMEKTFGDPRNAETQKYLRLLIGQIFERFTNLDGLVVRVGETYLQDAPFHMGKIDHKQDAQRTIIPLVNLLRQEICVNRGKKLIFRTWLSFDTDLNTYLKVSNGVEPHPNLIFGVKHVEGDFHRSNPFSKIIGEGRHRQIIEVQCSREYEGKGAYPNYIAHGVIDGFEEHRLKPTPARFTSIGEFAHKSPLWAGLWTWSRGGGWGGPYIKNELWADLNAWVLAQWAKAQISVIAAVHDRPASSPAQNEQPQTAATTEEKIFHRYATEQLKLSEDDAAKFRQLALLSEAAVIRGRVSTLGDVNVWWSRDDGMTVPPVDLPAETLQKVLAEKDEAVELWGKIVALAKEIHFADPRTADFVVVSCRYGQELYRIYQAAFHLAVLGKQGDPAKIRLWLERYDQAWADYRALPSQSDQCPTLYREAAAKYSNPKAVGIDKFIAELRTSLPKTRP